MIYFYFVYLVFGREGNGLTYEELKLCDLISTIPTNDKYGILNLAVSAIIYMYELNKRRFLDLVKYQNKY
ncbi:MAG: TrmH family RNA methyltransferase [Nanopusillaceae archaeon]